MNELIDANTHLSIFKVEKLMTGCRTLRNFSIGCVEVKNGLLNVPNAFGAFPPLF